MVELQNNGSYIRKLYTEAYMSAEMARMRYDVTISNYNVISMKIPTTI